METVNDLTMIMAIASFVAMIVGYIIVRLIG